MWDSCLVDVHLKIIKIRVQYHILSFPFFSFHFYSFFSNFHLLPLFFLFLSSLFFSFPSESPSFFPTAAQFHRQYLDRWGCYIPQPSHPPPFFSDAPGHTIVFKNITKISYSSCLLPSAETCTIFFFISDRTIRRHYSSRYWWLTSSLLVGGLLVASFKEQLVYFGRRWISWNPTFIWWRIHHVSTSYLRPMIIG